MEICLASQGTWFAVRWGLLFFCLTSATLGQELPPRMAAGEMSIQLNAPFPDDGRVEFKANRNSGQAAKGSEHDRKHDSETWPNGRKVDENQLFELLGSQCEQLFSRQGSSSSIKMVLLLGALSLAPAMLLMTTCYIRMIVVLMLMRQAFGGQQLPPNQVLTALALFLTVWVMAPVWNEVKSTAIDPYTQSQSISWEEAWSRGVEPIKRFMARQIELTQNTRSIALFYRQTRGSYSAEMPASIDEVPLSVMLPAFLVSELKVAFLLGFQILLPFLVLDFVVSTVTVSMGMLMLPPTMVSFPLKLILFVMVDGWNLVVGMLLQSLGPIG